MCTATPVGRVQRRTGGEVRVTPGIPLALAIPLILVLGGLILAASALVDGVQALERWLRWRRFPSL